MMPGEMNLPVTSITSAPAGIVTFAADRGDLPVAQDDRPVRDRAARDGDDRRPFERDDGGALRLAADATDREGHEGEGGREKKRPRSQVAAIH